MIKGIYIVVVCDNCFEEASFECRSFSDSFKKSDWVVAPSNPNLHFCSSFCQEEHEEDSSYDGAPV